MGKSTFGSVELALVSFYRDCNTREKKGTPDMLLDRSRLSHQPLHIGVSPSLVRFNSVGAGNDEEEEESRRVRQVQRTAVKGSALGSRLVVSMVCNGFATTLPVKHTLKMNQIERTLKGSNEY
jgi:hypothetical protein